MKLATLSLTLLLSLIASQLPAQNYHGISYDDSASRYHESRISDLQSGIDSMSRALDNANRDYNESVANYRAARNREEQQVFQRQAQAAADQINNLKGNISDNHRAIERETAELQKARAAEQAEAARKDAEEKASRDELEKINARKAQAATEQAEQERQNREEAARINEENRRRLELFMRSINNQR